LYVLDVVLLFVPIGCIELGGSDVMEDSVVFSLYLEDIVDFLIGGGVGLRVILPKISKFLL